jgi:conjugal transfer ATP-binding protein TraC
VVELDELQERQDLQSIVLQMMILSITNKIFLEGGSQAPFIIILGESSNMLRGPYSGVLIDMLSRRIRKYNGYLYVGARLVNDF